MTVFQTIFITYDSSASMAEWSKAVDLSSILRCRRGFEPHSRHDVFFGYVKVFATFFLLSSLLLLTSRKVLYSLFVVRSYLEDLKFSAVIDTTKGCIAQW